LVADVTVAEAPAPPTPAPPEERVETAPERKPWGFLVALGALLGILIATRRRKREEEERR
jgi:cell division septation protein DedD